MTSIVTKIAIAAVVALGAIGATAPAQAASVDVVIKPKVIVKPAPYVVIKPAPRVVVVKPAPVIVAKPAGRCQPGLALAKASRDGLNKVAISHIGPNRVTVSGKIRGAWAKISYANLRGCPRL